MCVCMCKHYYVYSMCVYVLALFLYSCFCKHKYLHNYVDIVSCEDVCVYLVHVSQSVIGRPKYEIN